VVPPLYTEEKGWERRWRIAAGHEKRTSATLDQNSNFSRFKYPCVGAASLEKEERRLTEVRQNGAVGFGELKEGRGLMS